VLYVGMDDPSDPRTTAEISNKVGMKIQPVLVASTELENGIQRHYHSSGVNEGFFDLPVGRSASSTPNDPVPADDMEPLEFAEARALPTETPSAETRGAEDISKAPALPPEPAIPASSSSLGVSNDAMLRAIAQLLVEKGVITREELVERLQTAANPNPDA